MTWSLHIDWLIDWCIVLEPVVTRASDLFHCNKKLTILGLECGCLKYQFKIYYVYQNRIINWLDTGSWIDINFQFELAFVFLWKKCTCNVKIEMFWALISILKVFSWNLKLIGSERVNDASVSRVMKKMWFCRLGWILGYWRGDGRGGQCEMDRKRHVGRPNHRGTSGGWTEQDQGGDWGGEPDNAVEEKPTAVCGKISWSKTIFFLFYLLDSNVDYLGGFSSVFL